MAMSSNFRKPVISNNAARGRRQQDDEFVPADFWLNVGYVFENDKGEMDFLALEKGIPLDQVRHLSGAGFISQAKNDLLDDLMAQAEQLQPGESRLIAGFEDAPLQLQLRRKAADNVGVSPDNTIAQARRKLSLV